ncbi:GPI transamidase component GAA1 [Tolypocladium ophioglossoides CBS 100239]|uniref:GPI transamidase component GAA1 n=1 Tax=Tolypocladium ophioglossoides (strain CBS 100239) TaxID=1163406 RepID=A0A0L0NAV9_TOLOC|nr:GPI transamidase component GAA1 [Tolypocladium ophioglossoides CBS 100239]
MSRLLSSALSLRRDPRILKLPPYLSLLCIAIGVVWLLLLPLDNYSRRTYISENALLPGQVHTYFGGSEQNVFRAYRHELDAVADKNNYEINDRLETIFKGVGIKVGRQNYTYYSAGEAYTSENIYGILQAPRGDATEAIVLVAGWRSIEEQLNRNGVALALTLARYFKRWSLWSKDIILVVPPDSRAGTQAWVDAYHDAHDPVNVDSLPLKSGALQGAIAIDYPSEQRFEGVHIIYDGTNGQLPNLDLINSIVNIAGGQMGIQTAIQDMKYHTSRYPDRLRTMLRGMLSQGLGISAGPHSSFIPYHVDSVTLQPYGEGWHDEMAMGRIVEGTFRSLNNLLEHLHQSFFFYLLTQRDRFVSIGTYLPSAMLLSANFTIMAIFLWVKSGQPAAQANRAALVKSNKGTSEGRKNSEPPHLPIQAVERDLFLPLGVVAGCHAASILPLFVFNNLPASVSHEPVALCPFVITIGANLVMLTVRPLQMLSPAFTIFSLASAALPSAISHLLTTFSAPTAQHFQLTKSFSLLILGMSLATLATLNFSLAFLVGLLASPLTFVQPTRSVAARYSLAGLLSAVAPSVVVYMAAQFWNVPVVEILREASFGWNVWGMYTAVVIWCIWWPAWLVGMVNVLGVVSE